MSLMQCLLVYRDLVVFLLMVGLMTVAQMQRQENAAAMPLLLQR